MIGIPKTVQVPRLELGRAALITVTIRIQQTLTSILKRSYSEEIVLRLQVNQFSSQSSI